MPEWHKLLVLKLRLRLSYTDVSFVLSVIPICLASQSSSLPIPILQDDQLVLQLSKELVSPDAPHSTAQSCEWQSACFGLLSRPEHHAAACSSLQSHTGLVDPSMTYCSGPAKVG